MCICKLQRAPSKLCHISTPDRGHFFFPSLLRTITSPWLDLKPARWGARRKVVAVYRVHLETLWPSPHWGKEERRRGLHIFRSCTGLPSSDCSGLISQLQSFYSCPSLRVASHGHGATVQSRNSTGAPVIRGYSPSNEKRTKRTKRHATASWGAAKRLRASSFLPLPPPRITPGRTRSWWPRMYK